MKFRALLTLTAIVSSILGAMVVYLLLSVPNDLRADTLLNQARKQIEGGDRDKARDSLARIVHQYPRTDAAAAATVALVALGDRERQELARSVALLRQQSEQQTKLISELQRSVGQIRTAPTAPVTVTAPAPAATKKATAKKKTTPKKKTSKKKRTPKKKTKRRR